MKKIFVASASEAKELDELIRARLDDLNVKPIGWRGLTRGGELVMNRLPQVYTEADEADAIILIVTPEDYILSRGTEELSARDNIILEIGMAIAGFGKERTLIAIFCDNSGVYPKLPSLLDGMEKLQCDAQKTDKLKHEIKLWVDGLDYRSNKILSAISSSSIALQQHLNKIGNSDESIVQKYILGKFEQDVNSFLKNEIVLKKFEYFSALNDEINSAAEGVELLAVARMSADMWEQDPEQKLYAKKNLEAAARGARIRRLFICSDEDWTQIHRSAKAQIKAGIEVRRISESDLQDARHLVDIVIFKKQNGTARGYIADKDLFGSSFDSSGFRRGRVILGIKDDDVIVQEFNEVWDSLEYVEEAEEVVGHNLIDYGKAPGEDLKVHQLGNEMFTLEQAAKAKGIDLANELKTIILMTSRGFVALHLRGDREPDLTKVKNYLEVTEAYPLSADKLKEPPLNLTPGTASAVLEPVWSLPHLISLSLLALDKVSTNAGTLNSCYYFPPQILLGAKPHATGDFDCS